MFVEMTHLNFGLIYLTPLLLVALVPWFLLGMGGGTGIRDEAKEFIAELLEDGESMEDAKNERKRDHYKQNPI